MDFLAPRGELSRSDLECSGSSSEWNSEKLSILTKKEGKRTWGVIWSSLSSFAVSVSAKQECTSPPKFSDEIVDEKVEVLIVKKLGDECGDDPPPEKNNAKEKQKKNKKAAKPPRPPKGPLLDPADMIFVKEITELAMKRRERIERLRASKKSKGDKHPSFNNTTTALLITFLFLIVILFQGLSSRSNASPGPEHGNKGFISVQYFNNFAPFKSNPPPNSASSNIADFGLFSRGRITHLVDDTKNA